MVRRRELREQSGPKAKVKKDQTDSDGRHGRDIGYEVSAAPILYAHYTRRTLSFIVLKFVACRDPSA